MGIVDGSAVKVEEDIGARDYSPDFVDQLIMDSDSEDDKLIMDCGDDITEKCAICKTEVPIKEMKKHVKGEHGFGEEEYKTVSKTLLNDAPNVESGDKMTDSCRFKCKYLPCDQGRIV